MKRYITSLEQQKYGDYDKKDPDMPDCTICLVTFVPEDDIVAFSCDPKHYFHAKCAHEWLEVKTECPLCRHDFTEEINKYITNSDDIINDVARQAVNDSNQRSH